MNISYYSRFEHLETVKHSALEHIIIKNQSESILVFLQGNVAKNEKLGINAIMACSY